MNVPYLPYIGAILLVLSITAFLVVVVIKVKQSKVKQEMSLLRARMEEQERVMRMISMELHDQINQKLNLAAMTLKMILKPEVTGKQELFAQLDSLLDQAISDTHSISHSLNPAYLKGRTLFEAIRLEADLVESAGNLSCMVSEHGESMDFTGEVKLMVIRIVQEAIHNVLKHAVATKLAISLEYSGKGLELLIEDNGKGFDVAAMGSDRGMGIRSMRNRAQLIGAHFEMVSAAGKGTRIKVCLPASGRTI